MKINTTELLLFYIIRVSGNDMFVYNFYVLLHSMALIKYVYIISKCLKCNVCMPPGCTGLHFYWKVANVEDRSI